MSDLEFLRRALQVEHRRRYANAGVMLRSWQRIQEKEARKKNTPATASQSDPPAVNVGLVETVSPV